MKYDSETIANISINTIRSTNLFNSDSVRCLTQNDKIFRGFSAKMNRFNQLLNSKYFLLVFINTLEQQQREFNLHDRFIFYEFLSS